MGYSTPSIDRAVSACGLLVNIYVLARLHWEESGRGTKQE